MISDKIIKVQNVLNTSDKTSNVPLGDSTNSQASSSNKKVDIRKLKKTNPLLQGLSGFVIVAILSFLGWSYYINRNSNGTEVPLDKIITRISEGNYESITEKPDMVILEFKEEVDVNGQKEKVTSKNYAKIKETNTQSFYQILTDANVDKSTIKNYSYEENVIIPIDSIILIGVFASGVVMLVMVLRNMNASGGKIFEFGQSKARLLFGKKTGTTFKDVAGIDDAKEELAEIVDFLKNPKKYIEAGARIPKGVLLVGAPGTGKTLLARAIAGEAGVPFFHTSGSEFEEMLVGAGASRVRDLFSKAKRTAPCIIFIDEVDAIAKKRGTVVSSGNTEQTLNQLLVEMDGLEGRENVIVLAATNRPDVLDPAILRPGRFDRTVTVNMPDLEGRQQILAVHSKNKKFTKDADLELVARKTVGYTGADLENLLNEAAIMCAKENRKEISHADLMESFLKVKLGRKKTNKRTEEDIKRTAYHEAGHAVVARFTKESDPVEKISILSRGMSGGVTVFVPEDDSRFTTQSKMLAYIQHAVSGKVAEELFLGESSTGPASDIKQATSIAKAFVKQYGMSDKLGFVQYTDLDELEMVGYQYMGKKDYSEKTAEMIDEEIRKIMDEAQMNARRILESHKEKVEELVSLLLKNEVVDREEFEELFKAEKEED